MSYIVAFVKFAESSADYPMDCFRTDLKPGDRVVVRLADAHLKSAAIVQLKYLNWDCRGRIECKVDETTDNAQGARVLPERSPIHIGLSTCDALEASLRADRWIPLRPSSRVYRQILTFSNETQTANVLLRKNGVDLQLLPKQSDLAPTAFSEFRTSLTEGRVVRHFFAHTTFNLLEGIRRFATSFQNNENDYDRYFKPVGTKDKRTPKLKELRRGGLRDIYAAISAGAGDLAYLGDGIWLDPQGGTHNRGR